LLGNDSGTKTTATSQTSTFATQQLETATDVDYFNVLSQNTPDENEELHEQSLRTAGKPTRVLLDKKQTS
jgi:hypothetical protein